MENINKPQTPASNDKKLEWGTHNPNLTDLNFIDRIPKKEHQEHTNTDELIVASKVPIDDSKK